MRIMLLEQSEELSKDLNRLTEKAKASGDPKFYMCTNLGIFTAYMEKLVSIWDDMAFLLRADKRMEEAMQAEKVVDYANQEIKKSIRNCRSILD